MINTKPYIFFDTETGSLNPERTQVLSISSVTICPRKLEIIPDSVFNAFIKPLDDDQAIKRGLDSVQKSALAVNKIVLADLEECSNEETVFRNWVEHINTWNPKKSSFEAPIATGFNINGFDMKIVNRMCKSYGYWDDKKNQQKIFNPIQQIDLKDITWLLNENNPEIDGNSLDKIRQWLNLDNTKAHTSLGDVLQGAEIFCKCIKLIRHWSSKTKFK